MVSIMVLPTNRNQGKLNELASQKGQEGGLCMKEGKEGTSELIVWSQGHSGKGRLDWTWPTAWSLQITGFGF